MRASSVFVGCCWFAGLAIAANARAEIFVLANSGQVRGELLNKEESPRKTFVVKTADGGQVTLDKAQVVKVLTPSAAQLEYEEIAPRYPDTVEGQWQLAQWCLEHKLSAERRPHLQRLIELDPDHREARAALGYSKVDGAWVQPDQLMKQKGYVLYKGRWVFPQEVELLEQNRKDELAEKEWFGKLKRWRDELSGRDPLRAEKARDNIRAINDPYAVAALADYFNRETERQVREWYIESLNKIATTGAYRTLAMHAIEDADVEIRLACLDQLGGKQLPEVVAYFLGCLKSKDNVRVNRGGFALGRMKDPTTVVPLIEALVTKHQFKVITGPPPGATSATFDKTGSSGGGGLAVGGAPPKIITQDLTNREVHDALAEITGKDYGYDIAGWRGWLATFKKGDSPGVRRDGK